MSTYEEYKECYENRVKAGEAYQLCKGIRSMIENESNNRSGAEAKAYLQQAVNECSASWRGPDADAFTAKVQEMIRELDSITGAMIGAVRRREEFYAEEYEKWQSRQKECEKNLEEDENRKLTWHRATDGLGEMILQNWGGKK